MKKILLLTVFLGLTHNALAEPDATYTCVWFWYKTPAGQYINMPERVKDVGTFEGQTTRQCEMFEIGEEAIIVKENKGKYSEYIAKASKKFNVDYALIDNVIWAESHYRPNVVSPKGAQGLMQLIPDTATRFNVNDPFDPEQNIMGGTQYLKWLLDRFDGNIEYALAGYNAGEGNVDKYQGIPPFPETQKYVVKIMQRMEKTL